MKKVSLLILSVLSCLTWSSLAQTVVFSYTGSAQTYTVPAGVTSIAVDMQGAAGGNDFYTYGFGGFGGRVQGVIPVTPGQVLNVYVGGKGGNGSSSSTTAATGGFNGGAAANVYYGAGGGGASDIRIGGTALTNRVMVAGGGGGASYNYSYRQNGGEGGGLTGGPGWAGANSHPYPCMEGQGGTQSAGGSAATCYSGGGAGTLGSGGSASSGTYGGGGGGGYYGGGGGAYAGGGGGSSYTATNITNVVHTQGNNPNNGVVIISPYSPVATTFNYTGSAQSYTVPCGVTTVLVDAQGGAGGSNSYWPSGQYASNGGNGGRVICSLAVSSGQVLNVYVGGKGGNGATSVAGAAGYNGGGSAGVTGSYAGGGGGGSSDIRVGGTGSANRVLVAAGGGGAGCYPSNYRYNTDHGGDGGGTNGTNGYYNYFNTSGYAGYGATGGTGGSLGSGSGGSAGQSSASGGAGGAGYPSLGCGGGGGGYAGGGGGGSSYYSAGGGGSSYVAGAGVTSVANLAAYNGFSNGQITIMPLGPIAVASPSSLSFGGVTTGSTSAAMLTLLSASGLTSGGSLTITPTSTFQVSLDGITWYSSAFTYTYSGTSVSSLFLYVRFVAGSGAASANIGISGGGLGCTINIPVSGTGSTACSGTPSAGTGATINGSTSASGNASTSFTLNAPGATVAGGITYQWQVSTTSSSTGFANIPGAVTQSFVYTGLSANSWFRCVVSCGASTATSATCSATFTMPSSSCIPNSYTSCTGCGFFVTNGSGYPATIVHAAGTLSDASTALGGTGGSSYYYNNTGLTATFNPGGSYNCTTGGLTTNQISYSAWIDFNNNGSFDNATELVGGVAHYSNSSVRATYPLIIPATAPPGGYRMRIVMNYDAGYAPGANTGYPCYPQQNPCPGNTSTNVYYADTRDYKAIIAPATPALTATSVANFGNVTVGTSSVPVAFSKITASNLVPSLGYISVSAPTGFTVSLDGSTWGSTLFIPYTGGTIPETNLYIRFSPTATGAASGNVGLSGGGLSSSVNVAVAGTGNASACAGAPTTGTASISPTSGGGNTTFTLSLSGTSAVGGLYYQWQSSPNGTTWTNIAGGIYPTYTFTGIYSNMQYRCIVSCGTGASNTSNTASATYTSSSMAASSCTPTFSSASASCSTYFMWTKITGISGGSSFNDVTACNGTGYENLTSTYNCTLNAATTYTVTAGTGTSYYSSHGAQIYIDFNNNGTFVSSESVGGCTTGTFMTLVGANREATIPITIPAGVPSGQFRMRIVGGYSPPSPYPNMNPCGGVTYGDIRDYTVNILGSAPQCSGTPKGGIVSAAPLSSCNTFTPALFNVGETDMNGITYQWQSSSSATSGFTNIAGATNAVYMPTLSSPATIYYRNTVTCTPSGATSNSPAQDITYLAPPSAIGGALAVCMGSTTTLTNATSGGTWVSSSPSVAPIGSTSGVVNGLSVGTATITYTAPSGCQAIAQVTVNPQPGAISGAASICGGTGATTATLTNGMSGGSWTSGNPLLATVGASSGVVTGVGNGNPVITYAMPTGCFATTVMTVNAVPAITGNASVCLGYTTALSNTAAGGVWSSTNPAVATINSSGVVTSVSVGSTNISYVIPSTGCAAVQTVFVTNPPSVYTVTGGGTLCAGGTGVSIGLSNTNVGIAYVLYNGTTLVAGPVFGAGGSLSFGVFNAPGSYGVIANPSTPCATNMAGVAVVSVNPLPTAFSVTGGGNYCSGGSGVHVYLSSSTIGVNYQLMLGTTPVGAPVAGTSAALDFGFVTTAGTYTVAAVNTATGCANNMSGSVTVGIDPLPTAFAVTGGGQYCSGSTSTLHVYLSGSAIGTSYQLMLGGVAAGTPMSGTGSSLDFGILSTPGTYTVVATNTVTGCVNNMSGSATIIVNPLPAVFTVTGGGNYCVGSTTGVAIGLNGSTAGVNYQLYLGSTAVSGALVAGTGAAISFGSLTTTGTYTVVATNATTGCVSNMSGSAVVATNPLPTVYSVTGGGNYCAGGAGLVVGLSGSQTGVNYQLFCNGTLVGAGSGSGGPINFGIQFTAGIYTISAINATTGCTANMSGSVTIVINPLPNVYTVTQSASAFCVGSTGVTIGLNGSQTGVNYQLYNAGVPTGSPVAGTGASIGFGAMGAGTYTIVALNPSTSCTMNMSGSATVIANPVPSVYSVIGGGSFCSGSTGLPIGLSSSNTGISYQLRSGTTPVGPAMSGTGFGLNFGIISTNGTYNVVATNPATGCTSNMSGTATIAVNSLPTAYTVIGGGNYCAGGSGVAVGLFSSTSGVNYQLYNGTTAVGSVVVGTGGALTFGAQTAAGTYTVLATDATTGCSNVMTGSAIVTVTPLPGLFVVNGGGNYCSGGAGVVVGLTGSAAGINYQLMRGTTVVGAAVPGTGAAISFGMQTTSGTYTVVATNPTSGCVNTMTGSAVVNVSPVPASFTITGGGNYCTGGSGVSVGLSGSSTGISYQLYAGAVPAGAPRAGTGGPLNFGLQTIGDVYTVIATNVATGCTATMTGTTTVVVSPLPALRTVTGGGNFCTGGAGVNVGLDGSNTGTSYQLYNGAFATGAAVPGSTGTPINFGLQTAVGIYTVVATNTTTGCVANMTGSATVGVNPLPTVYTVTGGGNYCSGGSGVAVGLSNSNSGINYQLMNGASLVGGPVSGTGGPITFGLQTNVGTYTVVATNVTTSCTNNMGGSVTIGVNPLPVMHSVTGGGNYCDGGTGIGVGLDGSNTGTMYQLMNGGTAVGTAMPGTGTAIDFGLQTTAGVYTVVATTVTGSCTISMAGSASINIDPLPTVYTVIGGGNYCTGGAGVTVGLASSDPGVMYQLMNGGTMVGTAIPGTGTALDFGLQTAPGTYTVAATNSTTGCVNTMTGTVVVVPHPLPALFAVSGGGNYCAGGSGVHVTLGGSNTGVSYQLMIGGVPVGSMISGTGSSLDFGLQTAPGSYTVMATNNVTGCTNMMTGSTTININPLPATYAVNNSGTSYCAGGTGIDIWLTNSDLGINYQLYNGTTAMGAPRAGTGSLVDFGNQLMAGTYTVVGTASTGCSNTMTGSASVVVNALPTSFVVTGGGSYCNGGAGVSVGLSGSNVGVTYQLIKDGSPIGAVVTGTSGPISFGLQTSAGVYTVAATNTTTTCSNNMTGSVTVVVSPIPSAFTVTGGGNYCAGGPGVHVTLSGSTLGVNYQLYRGGLTPVGSAIAGTGSALDFGAQTVTGNYTVVATTAMSSCSTNMTGSVSVGLNPAPAVYPVIGGGDYCPGGAGVHVGISGSNTSASYQLYRGTVAVGSLIPGTGSGIDFGLQTTAGTYTVIASDNTTTCGNTMAGSATVVINTAPAMFSVVGGGNYCAGGAGVHVGISGSATGVNYSLYKGFSLVATKPGTGGPIDFGAQVAAGSYTVVATNATTGCQSTMSGTATIVVNAVVTPSITISTPSGDTVCEGTIVNYTATTTNGGSAPTYQWAVNGAVAGVGDAYSYSPANGDVVNVTLTSSEVCATPVSVSASMTMNVDPNKNPAVAVMTNPGTLVCQGTSVTFTASPSYGGAAPSYSWIKNGVPAGSSPSYSYVPGNGDVVYCVMTSNYHCRLANTATSAHVNMEVAPSVNPAVTVTANPGTNIAAGQSVTFTAAVVNGGPTPSYQWLVNGTPVAGATLPSYTTSNLANKDTVACQVLSSGGCAGLLGSGGVRVNVHGVGVQQVSIANSDIKLLPNPNKGIFTVKGTLGFETNEEVSLEVTNMLGQVIYKSAVQAHNGDINERIELGNGIANGMYILSLRSGGESKVFHLVIEQ